MSTSDGKSTTRPLGRRRSKRFDRSGAGSPATTGSATLDTGPDDVDIDVDIPEPADEVSDREPAATGTEIDPEVATPAESSIVEDLPDGAEDAEMAAESEQKPTESARESAGESDEEPAGESATQAASPTVHAAIGSTRSRRHDGAGRNRSLDQKSPCGRCGHDVSIVHIEVDGNVLMMESCDNCDTRRWQLAGEPIELQQALDHVGEHTGRRR